LIYPVGELENRLLAEQLFKASWQMDVYQTLRGFVDAIDPAIREEFKPTQVSYGMSRKFLWLTPLTGKLCVMNIPMYMRVADPVFQYATQVRRDTFMHRLEVRDIEQVMVAQQNGWLLAAYRWGTRRRPA
jgi:hypothetical protein